MATTKKPKDSTKSRKAVPSAKSKTATGSAKLKKQDDGDITPLNVSKPLDKSLDLVLRSFLVRVVDYVQNPRSVFGGTRETRQANLVKTLSSLGEPFSLDCSAIPCPKGQRCNPVTKICEDIPNKITFTIKT
jgi:hypothetical protein